MKITFDFGRYSTELRHKRKPAYVITKKRIDGHSAKLVSPWKPSSGVTGVCISVDHHAALCLWGRDLTTEQQQLALKVLETIRFGGPIPASVVPHPRRQSEATRRDRSVRLGVMC
jgi:hypothetical protein